MSPLISPIATKSDKDITSPASDCSSYFSLYWPSIKLI